MEYTSRRRRSYRIGIRIIGILFAAAAVAYLIHVGNVGLTGGRAIAVAIAVMLLFVGVTYIRQSFGITAYDITYRILPQNLELKTHNRTVAVPYSEITSVNLSKVRPDMDYYMLHIVTAKYNLIMHIEGRGAYAQQMYERLLEYTDTCNDTENPVESDSK